MSLLDKVALPAPAPPDASDAGVGPANADRDGIVKAKNAMTTTLSIIEKSIVNAPRSLQKRIGPSEIGMGCDHCLAARLAGWDRTGHGVAWWPFLGTCVHEHMERLFAAEAARDTPYAWRTLQEATVTVGQIGGVDITGSTDLYIPADQTDNGMDGMAVDWKIVGTPTLKRVKADGKPSAQYIAQAMLYAKGWNDAGHPTSHVCVQFFPRDQPRMDDGYTWIAPYAPDIAAAALERANRIDATLRVLEQAGGIEARDAWIRGLPRADRCWNCAKYPDWVEARGFDLLK